MNIKQKNVPGPTNDRDRVSRIINAALEVFSEQTFEDAGTDEIARRAKVSKRDIYANFSDKHALLAAAIHAVIRADDENFSNVIAHTATMSIKERLEIIGLALINEMLAPTTRCVTRLISSENLRQPELGEIYLEQWYARRCRTIAKVFLDHNGGRRSKTWDPALAAREYVALVSHLPQLMAMVGTPDSWSSKKVEAHVNEAVLCFLRAYPALS